MNRFRFVNLIVCLLTVLVSGYFSMVSSAEEQFVFISSGTDEKVYRCKVDIKTGEMTDLQVAVDDCPNGFLALHPTLDVVYVATDEPEWREAKKQGGIRAFKLDRKTGELTFINKLSVGDSGATHIEVSPDGKTILSCAYGGEGTSAIAIADDGSLVEGVSHIPHSGSSVHEKRQRRHHPHGIGIHPDGKFACVADLGNEHIEIYSLAESKIAKHGRWKAADGAGPRHVTWHPNGKWLYLINELDSTMTSLGFDSEKGELTKLGKISTLPEGWEGDTTTAEVFVDPSGKFVFGSNRGHDSTAVYRIKDGGDLELVEIESTLGKHPRHVMIDPTGSLYIASNMHSDDMFSFFFDKEAGTLKATGHKLEVSGPRCLLFVQPK